MNCQSVPPNLCTAIFDAHRLQTCLSCPFPLLLSLSSFVPHSPPLSLSSLPFSFPHVLLLPFSLLAFSQVVGTVVDLFGTLEFINNTSPQDEAALHLLSFGQVRLQRGLDMTFAGNIGRCGQECNINQLFNVTMAVQSSLFKRAYETVHTQPFQVLECVLKLSYWFWKLAWIFLCVYWRKDLFQT